MRKHRRRIKRRAKGNKSRKQKNRFARHLNGIITNRWTKITTYIIIGLEVTWVTMEMVWFGIDMYFRMKGM